MAVNSHTVSGSARRTKPGQFGDFLWEESVVTMWPDWQAEGLFGLGKELVAPVAECPILGSA